MPYLFWELHNDVHEWFHLRVNNDLNFILFSQSNQAELEYSTWVIWTTFMLFSCLTAKGHCCCVKECCVKIFQNSPVVFHRQINRIRIWNVMTLFIFGWFVSLKCSLVLSRGLSVYNIDYSLKSICWQGSMICFLLLLLFMPFGLIFTFPAL